MSASVWKWLLSLAIVPLYVFAEQQNAGDSPSGNIHFELRKTSDEGAKEIWLSEKDKKSAAVKLCDTPGWGNLEIHFSPDDYWLIVQDGGASLGVSLRLFKRDKGVVFKEIENADINGKAERLALQQNGLPPKEVLDHLYVQCLAWSSDSKTVLVRISGHGGTPNFGVVIGGWQGIYDLGSSSFNFDLAKMNRGAVEKQPKQ
jgi:hypothetical protein